MAAARSPDGDDASSVPPFLLPGLALTTGQALALRNPARASSAEVAAAVKAALACPCFDDVRATPCWPGFQAAFECYARSTAEVRGEECGGQYNRLLSCMDANAPGSFPELVGSAPSPGRPIAEDPSTPSASGNFAPLPGVEGSTERQRGPRPPR